MPLVTSYCSSRSRRQRLPAAPGKTRWKRRHDFDALGFGHLVSEADLHRRPGYSVLEEALYNGMRAGLAAAARLR
jgi:hypothetical protein